jgi:hypothetical protein
MSRGFVALLLALTALQALAMPRHLPVPGGVARVELPVSGDLAPTASFAGTPLLVVRDGERWLALVGLPIDQAPGTAVLAWQAGDLAGETRFAVEIKAYPTQQLSVAPKYVEPDPQTLVRIAAERVRINEINGLHSSLKPELRFVAPADGPLSSRFGLRRVFNGQQRSPHLGLDIAVPEGTPVRAPAAGTVVDVGDYYFWGNFVAVDHGTGLLTLYAHLSSVDVAVGQPLAQGAPIGAVGATGRVTGAHLHWSVILNGAAVDPELFLP